eukprot:scaffold7774_cov93-Isochrysis_galbana.AAC.4
MCVCAAVASQPRRTPHDPQPFGCWGVGVAPPTHPARHALRFSTWPPASPPSAAGCARCPIRPSSSRTPPGPVRASLTSQAAGGSGSCCCAAAAAPATPLSR